MNPSRSSTVMSLRMVALLTPRPLERATVWDPTGCAVSTYSSTIARRIEAFRSSSSSWSVTVPPGASSLAQRRLRHWHSIVPSANSLIGACAQDPERYVGGEKAATPREHGIPIGVREQAQRLEIADG